MSRTSLVAVSAAGPGLAPLRTVDPSEVAAALADSLGGGQPIATLPADPIERARAIAMLQPDQPVVETDAAVVVATSGSTGAPKGVVLSRAAIRASAEATHSRLGGVGDWALALPAHYVAGLMVLARACLGGTHTVPVRSDLRNLQEAAGMLSERRYISLVPAQLDRA
ncbi:MAG TPA: AMP-binding protein, partial [Propionibacteriaceae bacterium]|nr:AMP-binding protein [Propionibacteriaceae bacterium]